MKLCRRPANDWRREKLFSTLNMLNQYSGTVISCCYSTSEWLRLCSSQNDPQKLVKDALHRTVLQHPMLQVGMVGEDSKQPAFVELDYIDLRDHWEWKNLTSADDLSSASKEIFSDLLDTKFPQRPDRPMWKVVTLWIPAYERLQVIFAWNHPIADGIGGAAFHTSFLNHLNNPQLDARDTTTETHLLRLPLKRVDVPPSQDKLCRHPISVKFAITELWKELRPSSTSTTAATWAPINSGNCRTHVSTITVNEKILQNVLTACRTYSTTLTGLLHSLVLFSLSLQQGPETTQGFVGQTTLNMRPLTHEAKSPAQTVSDQTMSNVFSIMYHDFAPSLVARCRTHGQNSSSGVARSFPSHDLVWAVASTVRGQIQQSLDLGLKDKVVGLMQHIPDWRPVLRAKARRTRTVSWLVTNLGVFDGESSTGPWSIDNASFGISSEVVGAAIHICPMTIKGKNMTINVTWQDGTIDHNTGKKLVEDLRAWLDYLGVPLDI
jgi:hypothetical protein